MIKKFPLLLAVLCSLSAIAQNKPGTPAPKPNAVAGRYVIEGNIKDLNTGKVYFVHRVNEEQVLDSANIVNGKFSFRDTLSSPSIGTLVVENGDKKGRNMVVLENGNITVTGNAGDLENLKVSGTKENDILQSYESKLFGGNGNWESEFNEKYVAARQAKNDTLLKAYEAEYNEMDKKNAAIADAVIRENSAAYVAPVLLSMNMLSFDLNQVNDLLKLIEKAPKQYPVTAKLRELVDVKLKTAPGQMAPDIVEKDTSGQKDIALSSLRGKYVLVDFWASWCGPCRAENPNVVAAYDKFKDKNFTIYSVSLDKSRDKWIKAIQDDKLSWPNHVSDLKFWDNEAAQRYGVRGIPANFLLDPAGKIIATDLRGDELTQKLEEVLK